MPLYSQHTAGELVQESCMFGRDVLARYGGYRPVLSAFKNLRRIAVRTILACEENC